MRSCSRFLLPVLALALGACASTFTSAAAVVEGQRISMDEVEAQVEAAIRGGQGGGPQDPQQRLDLTRTVLLRFIQQRALRLGAKQQGIVVKESEIEDEFRGIRQRFTTEEEFNTQLREAGFTRESLRERIRDQILIDRLRTKLTGGVSDASVRARYKQQETTYRQIQVRHLLFQCCQQDGPASAKRSADAAKRLTQQALEEIRGGASFEDVARRRSEDTGSKAQGGLLPGWTPVSQLDPAFGAAAWDARIGAITGPVRSQFGYHLIVTIAKRIQPLAEVSAQIRESLETETGDDALREFITKQLADADVVVNPRYGRWDATSMTVVPQSFYEPAEPATDPGLGDPFAPFGP